MLAEVTRGIELLRDHLAGCSLEAQEIDYGAKLSVANDRGHRAHAILYYSPRKRRYTLTVTGGSDPEIAATLTAAAASLPGARVSQPPSSEPRKTAPVSGIPEVDAHVAEVLPRLHANGFFPDQMDPIPYGLKLGFPEGKHNAVVNVYFSKKKGLSVVAGPGPAQKQAEAIIGLMRAAPQAPAAEAALARWIGTDEAGKGDYFGPLVVAGACVDRATAEQLVALGATDSKRLNDDRIRKLASQIHRMLGPAVATVIVGPRRYNQLYADFARRGSKLNGLLAWGHGRVVMDLQERDLPFDAVVVDRFASQAVIRRGMPDDVRILARSRAEDNPAVAAASIVARDAYVRRLDDLSERYGVKIVPGAGPGALSAGRALVERHGADVLREVGKHHFRTTETILG